MDLPQKISIGVDLGGTHIKLGVLQGSTLLTYDRIDAEAHDRMADRLPILKQAIDRLLVEVRTDHLSLAGIGISFPSVVDHKNKKILSRYVKFTDADEIDLETWTQQNWGVPLALENDARAALVGEWQFGAGKGSSHIVMITLGTGVGSGVLLDGQLVRGAHHLGGNLGGHTIINLHGTNCNCGSSGCVETEASGWVLHDKYKDHPLYPASKLSAKQQINYHDVFECAAQDDPLAMEIKKHSLKTWAAHALNFVHHFDPELLLLGGGIMKSGNQILPYIQSFVDRYAWLPPGSVRIVPARYPDHAGVMGMAFLALEQAVSNGQI